MQLEIKEIKCPNCPSKQIKKHGTKKKKLQTLQRYFCNSCRKTFTLQRSDKTYPLSIILNTISSYNLGSTQAEVQNIIPKKFKIKPSQKTISNWINEYKSICAYSIAINLISEILNIYSDNIVKWKDILKINSTTK